MHPPQRPSHPAARSFLPFRSCVLSYRKSAAFGKSSRHKISPVDRNGLPVPPTGIFLLIFTVAFHILGYIDMV
ncbi:hypothetical protein HMPREF1545_02430 [Oscillibacter sp. KLE 1728]|nr:hypothetical protein HMPREF1545_02430 [Oscillibacter sp. KLE 1728]